MDTTIQYLSDEDHQHGLVVAQHLLAMSSHGKQRVLQWLAAVINEEEPIGKLTRAPTPGDDTFITQFPE